MDPETKVIHREVTWRGDKEEQEVGICEMSVVMLAGMTSRSDLNRSKREKSYVQLLTLKQVFEQVGISDVITQYLTHSYGLIFISTMLQIQTRNQRVPKGLSCSGHHGGVTRSWSRSTGHCK